MGAIDRSKAVGIIRRAIDAGLLRRASAPVPHRSAGARAGFPGLGLTAAEAVEKTDEEGRADLRGRMDEILDRHVLDPLCPIPDQLV